MLQLPAAAPWAAAAVATATLCACVVWVLPPRQQLAHLPLLRPACLPVARPPAPRGRPRLLAPLQNSSDFYRWLSELEAARSGETEGKFRRYAEALQAHLATCDGLLAVVKQVGVVGGVPGPLVHACVDTQLPD